MQGLRQRRLQKPPGVAESIEWARAIAPGEPFCSHGTMPERAAGAATTVPGCRNDPFFPVGDLQCQRQRHCRAQRIASAHALAERRTGAGAEEAGRQGVARVAGEGAGGQQAELRRENESLRAQVGQDDQLHGSSVPINTVRARRVPVAETAKAVTCSR